MTSEQPTETAAPAAAAKKPLDKKLVIGIGAVAVVAVIGLVIALNNGGHRYEVHTADDEEGTSTSFIVTYDNDYKFKSVRAEVVEKSYGSEDPCKDALESAKSDDYDVTCKVVDDEHYKMTSEIKDADIAEKEMGLDDVTDHEKFGKSLESMNELYEKFGKCSDKTYFVVDNKKLDCENKKD